MMLLKRALFTVTFAAAMLAGNATAPATIQPDPSQRYLRAATVESCRHGLAAILDDSGDVWLYYTSELHSGQRVLLILNDAGTPDQIADDVIEDVLYCDSTECKDD